MKIIIFLCFSVLSLFSVTIENKYILSSEALTSLVDNVSIYSYIKKNPQTFVKLPKKRLFDFGEFDSIDTKENSTYFSIYIYKYYDKNYVYIKIPSRFLKYEFSLLEYGNIVSLNKSKYYILRFKKDFKRDDLTYLTLDIGKKKEFVLNFKGPEIRYFVKNHFNVLFKKSDLFDSIDIRSSSIKFTINYTKKDIKLNPDLMDFVKIKNNTILSKKTRRTFLVQVNKNLPPLKCEDKNLLESILIDDEEFTIGEDVSTESIYALYLLSSETRFSKYLEKIDFIKATSKLSQNVHTISYRYNSKNINLKLDLPKNITDDIRAKYVNSFNSFKFKINKTIFDGYIDGKYKYEIQNNICEDNTDKLDILNTKNYSEYKKWNIHTDIDKNLIVFTPIFNIYKISPVIYAPFLLKKSNKYVISSAIDESSDMKGEVKYAYIHNGIRFQSSYIVNPKTNTNIYFKYPKKSDIQEIIKKTNFIYNSNIMKIASSDNEKIQFTASAHNKITLIYFPTGNLNSFRQYFMRHFDCNQPQSLEDEICFDYLADMENAMGSFLQKLKSTKAYSQIVYRKSTYKEHERKNLILINTANRAYEQAGDDEVLGGIYDRYKWNLQEALEIDKKIFANYGLANIDLIYFSNIGIDNIHDLETLNNAGFAKVKLINFGHKITNEMSGFENIEFIDHKYNKDMMSGIQEFDTDIFDQILKKLHKE